jgi:hypothetical protein
MPGVGIEDKTVYETNEDGERVAKTLPLIDSSGESQRVCRTCFLAEKCPQYDSEYACAFNLPVEARTAEQRDRLDAVLIEIQTQRTLFGKFAEDMEGGYPDPNVSKEIDRLHNMLAKRAERDADGFSITLKAQSRSRAEGGLIGQLFGGKASEAARAIEPVRAEDAAVELGIVEAEIVSEYEPMPGQP